MAYNLLSLYCLYVFVLFLFFWKRTKRENQIVLKKHALISKQTTLKLPKSHFAMTSFDCFYGHLWFAFWSDDLVQLCFSHLSFILGTMWLSTPSENWVVNEPNRFRTILRQSNPLLLYVFMFFFVCFHHTVAKSQLASNLGLRSNDKLKEKKVFFFLWLVNSSVQCLAFHVVQCWS